MKGQRADEFGPFGSAKPTRSRGRVGRAFKGILVLCLLTIIPVAVYGWNQVSDSLLEREAPSITPLKPPPGIGLQPVEVSFKVNDGGSGIDEVVVRATQGGDIRELHRQRYTRSVKEDTVTVSFNGKESGLREGPVEIELRAFDKSFWSNSSKSSIELQVDFRRPRIEVVTTQHNAVRGGVELVFYRIIGDQDGFSGVNVGAELFPGFLARKIDSDFDAAPDVYFAFFAIPWGFNEKAEAVRVLARDSVGNTSTASMYYRVREVRYSERQDVITPEFLEKKVDAVYKNFLKDSAKKQGRSPKEFIPAIRQEELLDRYKLLMFDYQELADQKLKSLFSKPRSERFWSGTFQRVPGRRLPYAFGDMRSFKFEEQELARIRQAGLEYRTSGGNRVLAANAGRVVFAGLLGVRGNTVLIDHGFGLATLYSHLRNFERVVGDTVKKGEPIGIAGATGLVSRPTIGFEFRLHGMPVRPAEWWDENWLKGHIEDKIQATKKLLGIRVQ